MAMSLPQKIAPAVIRMMTDTNQFSVRTVIAEQNNQLLGYIGFRIINAQVKSVNFELMKHDYHPFMKGDEFQDVCYILALQVHRDFARQHIGTNLMNWLLRYLSECESCCAIYLHTWDTNFLARKFYKHTGFYELCVQSGVYRFFNNPVDAIVCVLDLVDFANFVKNEDLSRMQLYHINVSLKDDLFQQFVRKQQTVRL